MPQVFVHHLCLFERIVCAILATRHRFLTLNFSKNSVLSGFRNSRNSWVFLFVSFFFILLSFFSLCVYWFLLCIRVWTCIDKTPWRGAEKNGRNHLTDLFSTGSGLRAKVAYRSQRETEEEGEKHAKQPLENCNFFYNPPRGSKNTAHRNCIHAVCSGKRWTLSPVLKN